MNGSRQAEVLASGFRFLEGPRWHDGRLYVSDFHDHVVRSFGPDGSFQVLCTVPAQPSGLGFLPSGELAVVSMRDRRVLRLGPGGLETYADLSDRCEFMLNDMLIDGNGVAYVGNFGYHPEEDAIKATDLFLISPSGDVSVAASDVMFPNGMARPAGTRTLLVAESYASRIAAFDVADDGTLSGRREWARFAEPPVPSFAGITASDVVVPDGICADAEGALWVANANGPGVLRVAEGGEVLEVVGTGSLAAYAVALGGDDGRTLFICAAGTLGSYDARTQRRSCLLRATVEVPAPGI